MALDNGAAWSPWRRRGVVASMCFALALVVSSVSSLNVALPQIALDLVASPSQLTWVADSYTVVLAALVLPFGALGDRFGRRRLLLLGTIVFGLGSLAGAGASSVGTLVACRSVMGVGAAMIMPGTLSTITAVVRAEDRDKASGLWSGVAAAGGFAGLVQSGALLEQFRWTSTFVATAMLSGAAFLAAVLLAPETADDERQPVDLVAGVLAGIALGALVFAIIEGTEQGFTNAPITAAIVLAVVATFAFLVRSLLVEHPLLDPRLFALRGFATGTITIFVQYSVAFGFLLVALQFVQLIFGYSTFVSSLALIPIGAAVIPVSLLAPRLSHGLGARTVIAGGLTMMLAGSLLFSRLTADSSYWVFVGIGMLVGAGIGVAAAPATSAIVESLPRAKQGVASAVNDVAREVGAAIGIAVLGSLLNSGYRHHLPTDLAILRLLPPAAIDAIARSPTGGLLVAQQLGPQGTPLRDAVRTAFAQGFGGSMYAAAGLGAAALAIVLWRAPRRHHANPSHLTERSTTGSGNPWSPTAPDNEVSG